MRLFFNMNMFCNMKCANFLALFNSTFLGGNLFRNEECGSHTFYVPLSIIIIFFQ